MNVPIPPEPNQLVFLGMAGLAAMMAVGVVVVKSPVRAAICLVINFFVLALIYFGLSAQLLGITQILVYTGAIMVLFLFVIMLLNLAGAGDMKEKLDVKPALAGLMGLGLLGLIGSQVVLPLNTITTVRANDAFGTPQAIGKTLWTTYAYPIELISILLLVGIVGSIVLAKRRV
ncbi:MAG: NADH-quinone oxidoreductase subunit J [Chthonomonas sp.]|nr:NADH-quinone oxidoreductase subunit J [Chthonomonas sp.]